MPGKVKYHEISKKVRDKYLRDFYLMVSSLSNSSETEKFFKDLLTSSEIIMISRRIQIAKMLLGGNTHMEIKDKLKVGSGNINQVERWLHNGLSGYNLAIKNIQKKNVEPRRKKGESIPYSLDWLREKYPMHFLLVNILKNDKISKF